MMRALLVTALLIVGTPVMTWWPVEAPDGTLRVKFPDERPVEWKRPSSLVWTTLNRPNQYMVQESFEPQHKAADAAEILRNYPNPQADGIDGKVVEDHKVRSGSYTGREVRIEGFGGRPRIPVVSVERAFVTDGHLYVVSVHAANGRPIDEQLAREFFGSFVLLK